MCLSIWIFSFWGCLSSLSRLWSCLLPVAPVLLLLSSRLQLFDFILAFLILCLMEFLSTMKLRFDLFSCKFMFFLSNLYSSGFIWGFALDFFLGILNEMFNVFFWNLVDCVVLRDGAGLDVICDHAFDYLVLLGYLSTHVFVFEDLVVRIN